MQDHYRDSVLINDEYLLSVVLWQNEDTLVLKVIHQVLFCHYHIQGRPALWSASKFSLRLSNQQMNLFDQWELDKSSGIVMP